MKAGTLCDPQTDICSAHINYNSQDILLTSLSNYVVNLNRPFLTCFAKSQEPRVKSADLHSPLRQRHNSTLPSLVLLYPTFPVVRASLNWLEHVYGVLTATVNPIGALSLKSLSVRCTCAQGPFTKKVGRLAAVAVTVIGYVLNNTKSWYATVTQSNHQSSPSSSKCNLKQNYYA